MNELTASEKQVEQTIKDVSKMFEECVEEIYKGAYPDLEFKIYVTYPKYENSWHAQSMLRLILSSDSADESDLENKMEKEREPIVRCVNKKLSNNYPDVTFCHAGTPVNSPNEAFDLDKSQFLAVIESSLKNNWYIPFLVKLGKGVQIIRNTDWVLETFTEKDIKDLVLLIFSEYNMKSVIEFFNKHRQEIVEYVKNLL